MAAVEGYTMQPDFLHTQDKTLAPTLLSAEDATPSRTPDHSDDVDLPRAASYTYFPSLNDNFFDAHEASFSIDNLLPDSSLTENGTLTSSGETSPDSDPTTPLEIATDPVKPSKSTVLRNSLPQLATTNATANKNKDSKTPIEKSHRVGQDELTDLPTQMPTPSSSLSSRLRRRSWMPSSRSPSPRKPVAPESPIDSTPTSTKGTRNSRRNSFRQSMIGESAEKPARSRSSSLSRRLSNKLRGRTLNAITDDATAPDSTPVPPIDPKVAHLPVSFSSDKLAASAVNRSIPASERRPLHPRAHSREGHRLSKEGPRKRDELWTAFRTLDAEFQKFNSKPSALKGNAIRQVLKPFLDEYKSHPSVDRLRPEDLERRATILNKWWTSLLELLHGKNNQSISATDRPAIFDGIIGIMERPEWRLAPSPFCPLSERNAQSDDHSASSGSLSSQSSDYVMESVHHNIRSIFSFNILTQMTFVVDKMDKRPTPASLVQFCGQTCAYAFFFCPGIADVLVRLWNPTMGLLNRVLVECELPRAADLTETSKTIGCGFPPHLRSLQYTTLASTYRSLRKPAPLPPTTHDLPWSGVWVNRWTGKDSDLFYIFAKHYHLLVVDFLPATATRTERLCAPGLIFVHAQMLVNMDLTIRRDGAKDEDTRQGPSNITFDDVLSDPDATAPTLPLPPPTSNATRMMADNRLIALLREILHTGASYPTRTRQIIAQAFADTLKAAARRTSIYNLSACYVLCDFLEEAFFILVRYERVSPAENTFLDWPFWLDVWRNMVKSNNTTTEIRLYALLYTLWIPITADPARKIELCSSFLLQPDFFQSRFNHWCPMVRTYFMRLLCWRVARYDGAEQHGDKELYECLSELLHKTYGHYLYKQQYAQEMNLQAPSTTPCNPAPQRRLLIIRTDPLLSRGTNLPFGDPASQRGGNHKRESILSDFASLDLRPDSGGSSGTSDSDPDVDEKTPPPKKWGLLRTIIGTSKQEQRKASSSPSLSAGDGRNRGDPPRSVAPINGVPIRPTPNGGTHHQNKHPNQRPFSFKFSLEWTDRLDRRLQNPGPMRILPPRLPGPAQELLQASRPVSEHSSTTPSLSSATLANGSDGKSIEVKGIEPVGEAKASATYSGRSLAEWMLVVSECQSFFERRKSEGVPGNRWVETPSLGVQDFKRPG